MPLDLSAWELLGLVLLGAWVSADTSAWIQSMVSQPLPSGGLAGAVVGEPGAGLAVGLVFQVAWGRTLPMGAASFPLVGPATVVAAALAGTAVTASGGYAMGALRVPPALEFAAALAVGLVLAEAGRRAVQHIRRSREKTVARALRAAEAADGPALVAANRRGVLPHLALGGVMVAAGLALGLLLALALPSRPHADGRWVFAVLFGLGLGQTATLLSRPKLWWWAAATLVLAVAGGARW